MTNPYVVVLGIAQDGGLPHAGCRNDCCKNVWSGEEKQHFASCLGIVDPISKEHWMIDATPDFKWQLHNLLSKTNSYYTNSIKGIFITHGHIGHYTGLLNLEKAVMDTSKVPVFVMPLMAKLLSDNLPWKRMIENQNIILRIMQENISIKLNERISLTPIIVPHRDEYTETVGFIITGKKRKALYIPDIDSWKQFDVIDNLLEKLDIILVDGTFFNSNELKGRDMSMVPHPTIELSIERFNNLPEEKKNNFYFIHLNHTNPCLDVNSESYAQIIKSSFHIAREGLIFKL